MKQLLYTNTLLLLLCACSRSAVEPSQYQPITQPASILPDITGATIPVNIAPLNFSVCGDSIDQCVARFDYPGGSVCFGENHRVMIEPEQWRQMLTRCVGDSLYVTLYTHSAATGWLQHPRFGIEVVSDSIDRYVAYRLIPPYNTYERISLAYRDLESFDEVEYYTNQMLDNPQGGHCVNCHAFQGNRPNRYQLHVREEYGGTVVYNEGRWGKYNMKLPNTISGAVYPAWHPTLPLIAYSVNKTFMEFHTNGLTKSEVQDTQSGLILYDADHERVIPICDEPDLLETFPTWSPDGQWLYYSSACFTYQEADALDPDNRHRIKRQHEVTNRYREVRYDIYRRRFDARQLSFGEPQLVLNASADSLSATLPRISPDGRWLLTSIGGYGCFHVYHPEADLRLDDLSTLGQMGQIDSIASTKAIAPANSPSAESYHNWSHSGRWIVYQSRRRDDNYTRLYFSYFDREGRAHKPFEMPQADPDYELLHLRSYNIPEFLLDPIPFSPAQLARTILTPTRNVKP